MRIDVDASLVTAAHARAVGAAEAAHEAACERAMERLMRRFTRAAVAALERSQGVTAAAAGLPEWRIPLPAELLDQLLAQDDLEATAKTYRDRAARTSGNAMALDIGIAFDLRNRLLDGVIASQSGMQITTAPRDLVDVLMRSLQDSYDTGASIPRAARAMRSAGYTHAKGYAERIARTELVRATNDASLAMVMGATTVPYKTWMATLDGRTRLTHRIADGQTVPVASPFSVGSGSLNFPGDPNGPGDEVVNCRCTLGYADTPNVNTIAGGTMATRTRTTTQQVLQRETLRARAAALAAAAPATVDEVTVGASWAGPIAQEGIDTGDGRRIEPGALGWRALPLTLMGQKTTPAWGGHEEAQVSGRIDTLTRNGADIDATGVFDTGEWGADIERLVREKMLNGVSVDLAINEAEVIPDPDIEDPEEAYWYGTLNVLDGTILGATVVPFPAFENAQIAIVAGGAMRLYGFRRETIDGVATKVCSFFFPFAAAFADDETDPQDAVDDAAEAVQDITDAVNGWPGLDGDVVITIDGNETTVPFPPATPSGDEPGEAASITVSLSTDQVAAIMALKAKLRRA